MKAGQFVTSMASTNELSLASLPYSEVDSMSRCCGRPFLGGVNASGMKEWHFFQLKMFEYCRSLKTMVKTFKTSLSRFEGLDDFFEDGNFGLIENSERETGK